MTHTEHTRQRILLIGSAPENIGGISIHLRRLVSMLEDTFSFDFVDEGRKRWPGRFNIRSMNLPLYLYKLMKADIVHIHSGVAVLRMFHIVMARLILGKNTIVTVHRDPSVEKYRRITRWLLSRCNRVVMVSKKGYDSVNRRKSRCGYMVLPAFLPPDIDAEPALPDGMMDIISSVRNSNGILLVSNAWRIVWNNGEDLYGLDLCVEAMAGIKSCYPSCHLVFVVADATGSGEYIDSLMDRARETGVADMITIWTGAVSFARLVTYADVVLRPTNTDGDAISIREALCLGKRVVASDVVDRPSGVSLHRNRDAGSLAASIAESLSHEPVTVAAPDYKKIYKDLYLGD